MDVKTGQALQKTCKKLGLAWEYEPRRYGRTIRFTISSELNPSSEQGLRILFKVHKDFRMSVSIDVVRAFINRNTLEQELEKRMFTN